jgi:hypothetical protein
MKYGKPPIDLGIHDIKVDEIMFYQYLLIKKPGGYAFNSESRLNVFYNLVCAVRNDLSPKIWDGSYVYLTAKRVYVSDGYCGNRPGWHCDGFMSDDLNYIWCDKDATVFSGCGEIELTQDHEKSLLEMEAFVDYSCEVTYPVKSLLKLDQYVIHRCPENCEPGFRTFVKISVSKERYNLIGNSINYLLDYGDNWEWKERKAERNHPIAK